MLLSSLPTTSSLSSELSVLNTASSLASSVVDEGIFLLMTYLLHDVMTGMALTAVPVTVARVISSWVNFAINQKLVFESEGSTGKKALRYFATAVPLLIAQMMLTYGVYSLFSIEEQQVLLRGVLYAVVMTVLFFVNFFVQQRWVFSNKERDQ